MSFSTAVAHLPDGNDICYMDSGPVKGSSTYTTIVMLHGTGFNSHVFEPLFPLAPQTGLRIIAIQRREYRGSSGYTDAELDGLRKGDPVFLDRLATLLGHLIQYLIRTHDLPEPNAERTEGGVALLGWSMGCATTIPLLSDASLLSPDQYQLLRSYLIKVIFYDAPPVAFGFEFAGIIAPVLGKTPEEHYNNFRGFVSSYFDHPEDWDGDPDKLDLRLRTERTTTDSWSQEQWEKIFEPKTAARCEYPMSKGPIQIPLWKSTQRALFEEDCVKATFPDVAIIHIVCWRSNRDILCAYQHMKMLYQQRKANNEFVRPLSFEVVKDANHFWHWDSPNDFLTLLANGLRGN